eukprot:Sdes_comp19770_c0_seq1m11824
MSFRLHSRLCRMPEFKRITEKITSLNWETKERLFLKLFSCLHVQELSILSERFYTTPMGGTALGLPANVGEKIALHSYQKLFCSLVGKLVKNICRESTQEEGLKITIPPDGILNSEPCCWKVLHFLLDVIEQKRENSSPVQQPPSENRKLCASISKSQLATKKDSLKENIAPIPEISCKEHEEFIIAQNVQLKRRESLLMKIFQRREESLSRLQTSLEDILLQMVDDQGHVRNSLDLQPLCRQFQEVLEVLKKGQTRQSAEN